MRKRSFIFLLALIMCALFVVFGQVTLAATYFFESEPNDTRPAADGTVNLNTVIVGVLEHNNEQDWYSVYCYSAIPMKFYLDASAYYITGYIYDNNGNPIGSQINWHQTNYFTPTYTGIVYVKVSTSIYPGINYTLEVLPQ